jgi:hypothetical protein
MVPTLLLAVAWIVPQTTALDAAAPKARAFVLHLEDGTILRTRVRELETGYEVQARGGWTLVPRALVVRARSEAELLEEAARLARAVRRDDLPRRVAHAEWMFGEGLTIEGLKELDAVLERAPDQANAVALLARTALPLALPRAPESEAELPAYFREAARLTRSGRELALARLREAGEVPGLRSALAGELRSRSTSQRLFATLALRRLFPASEAEGLLARAVLDSSSEVRSGAALALRAFGDPGVIAPVVRAIGSRHPEVRTNAIEALSMMEYREAVAPLYGHLVALQSGAGRGAPRVHIFTGKQFAYVQDYDVEVAQGAAIADPNINVLVEGQVLDVAVVGVNEYVVASERASVRRALSKLTGSNPGDTTTAWTKWWKEHGAEWEAGASAPKAPTTPSRQG